MDPHSLEMSKRPSSVLRSLLERIVWTTGGAFTLQAPQSRSPVGRRRPHEPVGLAERLARMASPARPAPARATPARSVE